MTHAIQFIVAALVVFALGWFLGRRRKPKAPLSSRREAAFPLPLVRLDRNGIVEHANRAAEECFDAGGTALAGVPLVDRLSDAAAPLFLYHLAHGTCPAVFPDDRRGGLRGHESRAFVLLPVGQGFLLAVCAMSPDDRELFEPAGAGRAEISRSSSLPPAAYLEQLLALLLDAGDLARSTGYPRRESVSRLKRAGSPASDSPRVLVADDNAVARAVCGALARAAGFSPDFAVDGDEAVEKCRAFIYRFVLMDLLMPELNGDDAAKKIKRLPPPFNAVRIVAMSGTDSDAMRLRVREAGMDGFLAKPFTLEQLKSVLDCLHLGFSEKQP